MNREFTIEDLDIYTLLKDVIVNIWVVVLAALIAAMGTGVYLEYTHKPEYRSQVTFVVSTKGNESSMYSNLSTAMEMANIFTQIMDSDILREKAALIGGYDKFPGEIESYVIPETNLLVVSVKADSPYDSYMALKIITENYRLISDYIYGNAVLDVIEDIRMPMFQSNMVDKERIMKLAGAISSLLMIAGICALSFLRDTVKNEKHVSLKLDTKLLVSINHEKKNKTLRQIIHRTKKSSLVTNPVAGFSFVSNYQKLCMKIENSFKNKEYKTLMVTSVSENEGKSTVCANIALTLAANGSKVLVIDADLKKPAQFKIFEKTETKTLEEYFDKEKAEYDNTSGLHFILNKKVYENSAEILGGENFKKLLSEYAKTMDYILIDTPPLNAVSDGEIISGMTDATILVVRQDKSYAKEINDSIDIINQSGSELLGCVLNNVKRMPFAESYVENYYKSYYGKKTRVPEYASEMIVAGAIASENIKGE